MHNEDALLHSPLPRWALAVIAVAWLGLSAAVAWAVGVPYGLFMAWAGIAAGVFVLRPLTGMLGLLLLNVAAADWGQAFVLFPGTAYSLNQAGLANLVMLGLSVLYVLKRRPRFGPLTWPFLAFLAAGLVSIPFSASPFAGLRDWSRIAPLAGLYVVAADVVQGSPRRARLWIRAVVASSLWPAIIAIHQFFANAGYHTVRENLVSNRVLGTLGHPITYGAYLSVIVLLVLFLFLDSRRGWLKGALAVWGILSLSLLFLAYARGSSLAMFGALIVFGALARRESWSVRIAVCALAAAFLAATLFYGHTEDLRQTGTYVNLTPVPTAAASPQSTPAATVAQGTPAPSGELGGIAERFLELLARGRYSEAANMLAPEVAARVTLEQLQNVWLRIASPIGASPRCAAQSLVQQSGLRRVNAVCAGAGGSVKVQIAFDAASKIIGMGIDPGTPGPPPAPGTAPVPAAPIVYGVNSLSWRLNMWRYALDLALDHPITGIGLGAFPTYSPRLVGFAVTPHNDVVRVLVETGVLGLAAYLWLWAALAWSLFRWWRSAPNRAQSLLAATFIAVAAGYFAGGLSADLLNYPTMGWVFWSLMALPGGLREQAEAAA
jgi:hypothetical protein